MRIEYIMLIVLSLLIVYWSILLIQAHRNSPLTAYRKYQARQDRMQRSRELHRKSKSA